MHIYIICILIDFKRHIEIRVNSPQACVILRDRRFLSATRLVFYCALLGIFIVGLGRLIDCVSRGACGVSALVWL